MRKIYFLMLSMLLSMAVSVNAQTLLDEDFESTRSDVATTELPDGWTAVTSYTGTHTGYRWTIGHNSTASSTMSGYHYAYCDAPTYDKGDGDGVGPRKDMIITPAMTLNSTYQLIFDWEAAAYACLSQQAMTLQVAVIDMANPSDTTVIFDIQNEQQVRDSGVPTDPYGSYIWGNWTINKSTIDLDAYKGKTVKIAFIYNLQKLVANIVYLDNIQVKYHEALTNPIPELSQSAYTFGKMYIGEKHYSEDMTVKNVGKKGLKITGWDVPEGVTMIMDTAGVNLNVNETASFKISYKAGLATPASSEVVIHTNGGDATLKVNVTKETVPDGYSLELFEGDQFPPAGWTNNGWRNGYYAIEGDNSAYATGDLEDNYLTTPRLDLSDPAGPHKIMFTYYSYFNGEDVPYNDLSVWVSTDGGATFSDSIWVHDYTKNDTLYNIELDLSKYTSDNVKIRFKNSKISYDSDEGSDEWTTYILDRVLLPNVYGQDGVPMPTELTAPKDSTTEVYTKNITFSWREAQFADGYKIYIGKKNGTWDVVNGEDVGTATTYKLAQADYATTYFWKVVPYNSVGDATSATVWMFTTQADHSVKEFPWVEDFNDKTFAPLGWNAENSETGYTKWVRTDYHTYEGEGTVLAYANETEQTAYLYTPDITVPAEGKYQLSFWWGNDHPSDLVADNTAVHTNHTTKEDDIDAAYLDVWNNGAWQQVTYICDNAEADGKRYWCYETVDLTPYAGKTIQFRWRYISHNYGRARDAALDLVKIEANAANVSFSTDGWDAYKVNYGVEEKSPSFALTNLGAEAVTIKSVKFKTDYFTTDLADSTVLAANGSKQFTITFKASIDGNEPTEVEDMMTLSLSDGNTVTFPVVAIAEPQDYIFYGFESDKTGAVPNGFFGIDVDKASTATLWSWTVPNIGSPLSFFVLNDSECNAVLKEPHGSQSLMTRCSEEGAFDDWIVTSTPLTATANSKFVFNARVWESVNSVLPADGQTVNVWVSEVGGTTTSNYTQVGSSKQLELFDNKNWDELSYDLSAYAGKQIYIAVESTSTNCLGGFYDNFEFQHFANGYVPYDINGDGVVNVTDVAALINYILGTAEYDERVCDVDGSGRVNTSDVTALINYILGM